MQRGFAGYGWLFVVALVALVMGLASSGAAFAAETDGSFNITFRVDEDDGAGGSGTSGGAARPSGSDNGGSNLVNEPDWLVSIDDEEVPLAELPGVHIAEEGVPQADNPLTGVPGGLRVAMAAGLSAGAVVFGCVCRARMKKRKI